MAERKCVLVVDDDPEIRRVIDRMLSAHYAVLVAKDGFEGFDIAESQHVDLIILDLGMPRIDGFTLAAMIREHSVTQGIPILVLTGLNTREDERRALESGADMFLAKPFDPEELWMRTQSLIGRADAAHPGMR